MAQVPKLKQLIPEELSEAGSWIKKLITPINSFMRSITDGFNKGLTVSENMDGDIKTFIAAGTSVELAWGRQKPTAGWIVNIERVDNSSVTLPAAITPIWSFTQESQIKVSDIMGLDDSGTKQYRITMIFLVK